MFNRPTNKRQPWEVPEHIDPNIPLDQTPALRDPKPDSDYYRAPAPAVDSELDNNRILSGLIGSTVSACRITDCDNAIMPDNSTYTGPAIFLEADEGKTKVAIVCDWITNGMWQRTPQLRFFYLSEYPEASTEQLRIEACKFLANDVKENRADVARFRDGRGASVFVCVRPAECEAFEELYRRLRK